jgi:hypothetical protein
MTLPRNIDPPAISPEEEARLDLEQRSAADDRIGYDFSTVYLVAFEDRQLEEAIYQIYRSSGDDELLAVNDLKSLLFNTALELIKKGK